METEAQFDALGRVTLSRLLNCQRPQECPTTTIEYDLAPTSSGAAYAERVTVGSTAITLTDFDGLDRPLQVDSTVDGVQAIATNIYDRDGQLTDSTDPEGMKISHLYDPHGFRIATLNRGTDDGAGILTSFQNDAMGHVVAESEFPLDADGVRSLAQDMSGPTTRYTYDVWYRVREVQAPPVGSADDLGTQVDPAGQPVIMTYDGQGHLLSQSNRRGHTQLWVRNALGWMESYQDGSGSELGRGGDCSATLCYSDFDNNGNPRQVIDGRGAASEYVYDAEERITSVSEAEGRSTSVSSYDGLGRPLSTNEYGVAHEYAYNENGALRSDSVPGANFSAVHQYDELGRPTQTSRSRGGATFTAVTSYEAGSSGPRVTTTIDAAVDQVLQLDKAQNLLSRRDRTGVTEHYERDAFYRTERVTRERGGQNAVVSTFKYYSGGMVRQSTDADLSEQTNYDYDARGRLIRTTLPTASNAPAAIEQHAYDADGNRVATAHPTGGPGDAPYIEVMTYNGENQLLSHSAAGETTSYKYDVMGNLVEERLPKSQAGGPVKAMEYDLAGRVTMIDDRGLVTRFPEYDQRGNLKRQEIPGSGGQAVATSFDYDELNLVTSRTERNVTGGSATTSFGNYDPNGNFRSLTDANGASITYQYDAIGRRTSASYPGGSPTSHITWDYDDPNRKLTITESKSSGSDSTIIEAHAVWDAPAKVTRAQGATSIEVGYLYRGDGALQTVTSPEGTSGYEYNARNQLARVTVDGDPTEYTYYADGRPNAISYANDTTTTHRYEASRRIDSIATTGASYPISYQYDYDSNGNRTFQQETRDTDVHATVYGYDDQDRLARTEFISSGAPYPVVTEYGFEGLNRTTERVTVDGVEVSDKSFDYTAGNHLRQVQENGNPALAVEQYVATYDYDDNGNLVEKSKDTGGDLEVTSYDFDVRDHLRSVNFQVGAAPPTDLGEFDYDHAGLRVHASTPDRGDVDYFYDGDQVVEERDASSGSALARYHYGLATVAVSDLADGGATRKYFHHDGLGTTSHLTDDSGEIRADYMVDPWGQPRDTARYQGGFVHQPTAAALSSTGSDADRNRKLFTGHEYDKSSGLIYAKARYYDPDAGRFLSADSYLGDPSNPMSLHRYMYVHHNPATLWDPSGHFGKLKEWTDQMQEGAETARRNFQASDGGWKDVVAGIAAKAAGSVVGTVNLVSDAGLLAIGGPDIEETEWGQQAQESMYGLDEQIQSVKKAGNEGRLLESAKDNILDPLALTVGGTLMGDDGSAFDLMTGAGALAIDVAVGAGVGKVGALAKASRVAGEAAAAVVTAEVRSGARAIATRLEFSKIQSGKYMSPEFGSGRAWRAAARASKGANIAKAGTRAGRTLDDVTEVAESLARRTKSLSHSTSGAASRSEIAAQKLAARASLREQGVGGEFRRGIINSFESGSLSVEKLADDLAATRVFDSIPGVTGGSSRAARPEGRFVTTSGIRNRTEAASKLALDPMFNRMLFIEDVLVPKGTTVLRGRAAPQAFKDLSGIAQPGGGSQIFVPDITNLQYSGMRPLPK